MYTSIGRGALVKAWNRESKSFIIGIYLGKESIMHKVVDLLDSQVHEVLQIAKIPVELIEQLEDLGDTEL